MSKMTQEEADKFYGKDAAEWLRRWDAGETVWTIEMGGLGPGYEQCIQITAAEVLRHLLDKKYNPEKWDFARANWERDLKKIEEYAHANPVIKKLGLSGAQWGVAVNLASNLYRKGPAAIMNDKRAEDRKIQTRREMPQAA